MFGERVVVVCCSAALLSALLVACSARNAESESESELGGDGFE